MKLRLVSFASLFLGSAILSIAEPLARDATVYVRPDPASPVLRELPAGTVPMPSTSPAATVAEGWMAIDLAGPLDVFVPNKNVGKDLDVKPGALLYLHPDLAAPVVATMQAGDKTDLIGLAGPRREWSQYRLDKPVIGYIKLPTVLVAAPPAPAAASASTPAATAEASRIPLPRFFEGRFAACQNFLTYRHPYKFQLLDEGGNRFAYLDLSRLSPADRPEDYLDRVVVVFGTARTINEKGTRRLIDVETIRAK